MSYSDGSPQNVFKKETIVGNLKQEYIYELTVP